METVPSSLSRSSTSSLWVAVLHYGNPDCTRACIDSLLKVREPSFSILLIDNNSPDGSGPLLAKDYPQCSFLQLSENLGFAGGGNAGIRYCIEQGAEYTWLLNNDILVYEDTLNLLWQAAKVSPQAGALGALIYLNGTKSGAASIDYQKAKTYEREPVPEGNQPLSRPWLSGCNLLLSTKAFLQCGGFAEEYFLYFEDVDLCVRLIKSGFQCLLVPQARVNHQGGAATKGQISIWRSYYYIRNRLLFFTRHGMPLLSVVQVLIHLLRHSLSLPWRGSDGRRQLRAEWLGFRDYVTQRLGKANCLDF